MSLDSALEAIVHYSKKNELDQAMALLDRDVLSKHPRAWQQIIDIHKNDAARQTLLLAVVGGFRTTQLAQDPSAAGQIVQLFEAMVESCKPEQLVNRHGASSGFRRLMYGYVAVMREQRRFAQAVRVLKRALHLVQPMDDYLTPMHPAIVQLCLVWQNPRAALSVMNVPVFEIDPAKTGVKAVDVMAYFYYSGIVHTALRDYTAARVAFRNVLAVPAQALSQCMLLAFKCLTLLSAITDPAPINLPPNFDNRVERSVRLLARPYTDLVAALDARDDEALVKILDANRATFHADDLGGLVQQAIEAAPRQAIRSLTKVYVTLTLQQMAEELRMPVAEVERTLLSMIGRGELDAKIERETGNVIFGEGRVPGINEIQRDIDRVAQVNQRIRDIDDRVVVSKPHVMAKLRAAPNLRELLRDYEAKRKTNRGIAETVTDTLRGLGA